MKKRTMIVDSNMILQAAKYTMSENNQDTGVILGFFKKILTAQQACACTDIVFAYDSKTSKRKKLFPEYKIKRQDITDEERALNEIALPQFNTVLHELLPEIGFKNIVGTEGLEGDDIIASIIASKNPDDQIVIVSRDNDLWQLLIPSEVSQYDFVSGKFSTADDFTKRWGITPKQWGLVKAIAGCTSDCVPGIERVGPKTACKYLRGELKETYKTHKAITSKKGRALIDFNKPLVVLPFAGTPQYQIVDDDQLNFGALLGIFNRYNFEDQLWVDVVFEWENNFNWMKQGAGALPF